MTNATSCIVRGVLRNTEDIGEKLNIILLSSPVYESYNYLLSQTNHNFYLWTENFNGEWKSIYLPKPDNFFHLPPNQLIFDQTVDYDFIIIHNRMQQFDIAHAISTALHIPIICLHHNDLRFGVTNETSQPLQLSTHKIQELLRRDPTIAVYDQESIMSSWQKPGSVINPGIQVELFKELSPTQDRCIVPAMANEEATKSTAQFLSNILNTAIMGAAGSIDELLSYYSFGDIFINLESYSIDIRTLQAMASNCIVVSKPNKILESYFEDTKSIMYANSERHMFEIVQYLQSAKAHKELIKENAMHIIKKHFVFDTFITQWNELLKQISPLFYVR